MQIKNTDDRRRQGRRRNARVEGQRDGEDICKADAVQHVKGDEPADRNLCSQTRCDRCAHRKRDEAAHGHEAADADLGNFGRLRKFSRPESPEHDRAGKVTYRDDRVECNQPRRRHLVPEEDEVRVVLCPDQIGAKDLLVADNRNCQHRQKCEQRDDRHLFRMGQRNFRGTLTSFHNGRIGRKPSPT